MGTTGCRQEGDWPRTARHCVLLNSCQAHANRYDSETKLNKTKALNWRLSTLAWYTQLANRKGRVQAHERGTELKTLLLSLLIASAAIAQEPKVEATWLHRYVPRVSEAPADLASKTCHYKPVFGEGDTENRILRSVTRFAEVRLDAHGNCQHVLYDREEESYFILEGKGVLHYGDQTLAMRTNDF